MKVPNRCQVERCVTDDKTRPALRHVHFDGKNVIATDGRMMAIVPVQKDDGDDVGPIQPAAFKAARKQAGKRADTYEIKANGAIVLQDGTTMPRADTGGVPFPDYQQVVPSADRKDTVKVTFNAAFLHDLALAIGADPSIPTVTLEIVSSDDRAPIRVTVGNVACDVGGVGVLMPVVR